MTKGSTRLIYQYWLPFAGSCKDKAKVNIVHSVLLVGGGEGVVA